MPAWDTPKPLPVPTGSYAVGTGSWSVVDTTRATSWNHKVRPLSVQIWYPATVGPAGDTAPYMPDPTLVDSMMQHSYMDLAPSDMEGWAAVPTHALNRARPAAPSVATAGWPIIVLSHGLGVSRLHYTILATELASRGYVVLGIDHPIGGFTFDLSGSVLTPGVDSLHYGTPVVIPHVVRDWALDAAYVVREAVNGPAARAAIGGSLPLDTLSVGTIGHSLGGAAALQACRSHRLFRACINMDGHPFGDVEELGVGDKPFMVLLSRPDRMTTPEPGSEAAEKRAAMAQIGIERDSLWSAIQARSPTTDSYVIQLTGTAHLSFSDAPFQLPRLLLDVGATMSAELSHALVSELVLAFFDHYLRGEPLRLLRPGLITMDLGGVLP